MFRKKLRQLKKFKLQLMDRADRRNSYEDYNSLNSYESYGSGRNNSMKSYEAFNSLGKNFPNSYKDINVLGNNPPNSCENYNSSVEKPEDSTSKLVKKLNEIDRVIVSPLVGNHHQRIRNNKDDIETNETEEQIYVEVIKLPKSSSEISLSSEPIPKKILENESNLLLCPGCKSTILRECGPSTFPYLLHGVHLKPDYSINFIKRRTVVCKNCDHEVGFEWERNLYLKT